MTARACGGPSRTRGSAPRRQSRAWSRTRRGHRSPALRGTGTPLVALRQEECPFPEVREIDAHVGFWTKPEIVVEAHFLEFSKDRHMRAPSFSRVREDKRPEECVVTFS